MTIRKRWRLFILPFQWITRGCYDRDAHWAAWRLAFRLRRMP